MKQELDQVNKFVPPAIKKKTEVLSWLKKKDCRVPYRTTATGLMAYLKENKRDNQPIQRTFSAYAREWDNFAQAEDSLRELGFAYSGETSASAALVLGVLAYFDKAREGNPQITNLRQSIIDGWGTNLSYMTFICPPINVNGDGTGYYVYPNPEKTSIYTNRATYKRIQEWLQFVGESPSLQVFIGDTDDTDYLYPAYGASGNRPIVGNYDSRERANMIERMRIYTVKLIQEKLGLQGNVWSWFSDMPQKPLFLSNPRPDIANEEQKRISDLFSPSNFYQFLIGPTSSEAAKMADLKVATYGFQGQQIREKINPIFGIQSETPSFLRSEMFNIFNDKRPIPFIYPDVFKT